METISRQTYDQLMKQGFIYLHGEKCQMHDMHSYTEYGQTRSIYVAHARSGKLYRVELIKVVSEYVNDFEVDYGIIVKKMED
jgi:hypothetical protein